MIGQTLMFGNFVTKSKGILRIMDNNNSIVCPFCKKEVIPTEDAFFIVCKDGDHFQTDKKRNPINYTFINGKAILKETK
jgi:hypothetical protein